MFRESPSISQRMRSPRISCKQRVYYGNAILYFTEFAKLLSFCRQLGGSGWRSLQWVQRQSKWCSLSRKLHQRNINPSHKPAPVTLNANYRSRLAYTYESWQFADYTQPARMPPSTGIAAPVKKVGASVARKSMTFAISSGLPNLLAGCL